MKKLIIATMASLIATSSFAAVLANIGIGLPANYVSEYASKATSMKVYLCDGNACYLPNYGPEYRNGMQTKIPGTPMNNTYAISHGNIVNPPADNDSLYWWFMKSHNADGLLIQLNIPNEQPACYIAKGQLTESNYNTPQGFGLSALSPTSCLSIVPAPYAQP